MVSCDKAAISAYLNALLLDKGWSMQELSRRSGVPQQTVSRILNQQTECPQLLSVAMLADALGGSLDALAGISPPAPSQQVPPLAQDTIDRQDRSISYLRAQVAALQASAAEKEQLIARQRRAISRRNFAISALAVVIGAFVTWDLMDPRYGFLYRVLGMQEQSMAYLIKG